MDPRVGALALAAHPPTLPRRSPDTAQANPGNWRLGSSGPKTPHHLAGEFLKNQTGIEMVHVPNRGGNPAMTDFLAGQIPVLFATLSTVLPHMQSGIDWAQVAEPYRHRIARHLSRTMLPGLESEIVTSRLLTPPDFQDRLSSFRGAAFGLEPVLWQSAWFRPHNKSEEVEHLYLVGAGTHPGAGLPGVLSSARILDKVVPDAVVFAGR